MPWPWLFQSNFEQGDNSEWASEDDTGALLDFPHYSKLAGQYTWAGAVPYEGAYCMRVEAGDTNLHMVNSTTAPIPAASSGFFKFQLCVGKGWVTAGTTNSFSIFRLSGVATTQNAVTVGLRAGRVNATSVEIMLGTAVPTAAAGPFLQLGKWHTIEVQYSAPADITTGAAGLNTFYVDGFSAGTVTVTAPSATVGMTVASIGVSGALAANVGTLLFDDFIQDDTRIGTSFNRFEETKHITKSGHLFVGPGRLDNFTLIAQAVTTSVANLYDTDQAGVTSLTKQKARAAVVTNSDVNDLAGVPVYFTKGCYVELLPVAVASQPRAIAVFSAHAEASEAAKKLHGQHTRLQPGDAL